MRRFVAADAFEDGGAVADHVGEDVNSSVVPIDELPVVPDLFCFGDGHWWLRVQKISKNGYVGRVEQGGRGVNRWRGLCVFVGCSKLDGRP